MSHLSSPAVDSTAKPCPFERYVKPWLTPYYMTIAGVLGGVTAVFTVVIVLLVLVATNFNVLGWTE